MHPQQLLSALFLSGLVASAPVLSERGSGTDLAVDIIKAIMPNSATCGADAEKCCRTAEQAAPHFISAFAQYKMFKYPQMAAVLALTAVESVELKFNYNKSPGRPGQGTSNMQMPTFNQEYASSIPALAGSLAEAGTDVNKVLALVNTDEYNFGSGAWFMTTHCADAFNQLATDLEGGWAAYLTCVGVASDADREAYWTRAKVAFGLK